jgi:hypothetical protein
MKTDHVLVPNLGEFGSLREASEQALSRWLIDAALRSVLEEEEKGGELPIPPPSIRQT